MTQTTASESTHATLSSWHADKPVIGLMGEFSSGKSTLLNFLLSQDVATTKVTATPLPPIWFTYSKTPFAIGLRRDGGSEEVDMQDPEIDFRGTYLAIRQGIDIPALERCDIIDAPGISDPDLGKNALRFLQPHFDFVIWCTGASQAWRQTDKAAYEKLAKATKANSILVVTRIDKLRSPKDREKVLKRVRAETGDMFGGIVGLQTPKAAAIAPEDRSDAAESAWVKSGGHDFVTAFETALAALPAKPKPKSRAKPSAKPSAKSTATPAKPTQKGASADKTSKPGKPNTDAGQTPAARLVQSLEDIKTMPEIGRYCLQIDHLIASIACEPSSQKQGTKVSLACSQIEANGMDIERLVSQIGRELDAFSTGEAIRLDI